MSLVASWTRRFGNSSLRRMADRAQAVEDFAGRYESLEPAQLRKQSLALRYRAQSGEPLDSLLVEAFALVRRAAEQSLSMRHYRVQLLGGIALHHGCIAEMQTGEGKTLTATLPLYLASLAGDGVHLATANDYLASRDAQWMRPLYDLLGTSVGVVSSTTERKQRRQAYQCDLTYSTAKELGFDYLRDRLQQRRRADTGVGQGESELVQRGLGFALVDEADSILIDEARTPLVISAADESDARSFVHVCKWSAEAARSMQVDIHFRADAVQRTIELTQKGRQRVRTLVKPAVLDATPLLDLYEQVEMAILVQQYFQLDRHYVIRQGEVVIVDELTGRLAEGRKWRAGMHQAIEAKEGLTITPPNYDAARITIQDFFLSYRQLAGMTGTVANSAHELHAIYQCPVTIVPTHRPSQRRRLTEQVFHCEEEKWQAVVREVLAVRQTGRPVLIGTRSIDHSERLSARLEEHGIEHHVLNAKHLEREAEIVATAGTEGRVTVATNMAGRGTDIKLDETVAARGGLHVICADLHPSARIDRQLIGRCGRQGDPGSYRQFMSLDDEVICDGLGTPQRRRLKAIGKGTSRTISNLGPLFRKAQRRIERNHFRARKQMLYQQKQRRQMQREMGQDPYVDLIN